MYDPKSDHVILLFLTIREIFSRMTLFLLILKVLISFLLLIRHQILPFHWMINISL